MREITMFEADDGTVFNTAAAAIAHEKVSEIGAWYEKNKLYGRYEGCRIEWSEFYEWCSENRARLDQLLTALRAGRE